MFESFVREVAETVGGPFDSLVDIRVVKRITVHFVTFGRMDRPDEIFITSAFFAFAERERNGSGAARFKTRGPETSVDFYSRKWNRRNRIACGVSKLGPG